MDCSMYSSSTSIWAACGTRVVKARAMKSPPACARRLARTDASTPGAAGYASSTRSPAAPLPGHRPQTSGSSASSPFRRCRTILPAGSPHLPLSAQSSRGRADSRLPFDPDAPYNLEEPRALDKPRALELPQARQTNPMEYFGGRLPLFHRVSDEISEM